MVGKHIYMVKKWAFFEALRVYVFKKHTLKTYFFVTREVRCEEVLKNVNHLQGKLRFFRLGHSR